MGRVFEVGGRGVAAAAGAPYCSFHMGSTGRGRVREIGFFASAATLSSLGIGRPANQATPPAASTSIAGQPRDEQDQVTALGMLDTAWSTAPTAPSVYCRRAAVPAVSGAGIIWTWPPDDALIVKPSGWLTFHNFGAGAGAAPDVYVVWEE